MLLLLVLLFFGLVYVVHVVDVDSVTAAPIVAPIVVAYIVAIKYAFNTRMSLIFFPAGTKRGYGGLTIQLTANVVVVAHPLL